MRLLVLLILATLIFGGYWFLSRPAAVIDQMADGQPVSQAMPALDQPDTPEMIVSEFTAEEPFQYSGRLIAGKTAPLIDFNRADYNAALKTNKLVALYFYANWCPICREEIPRLEGAFNELTTDKVIGFRVNYNDNETDVDERTLASRYGVAYQHTKVFVKNGQRVLKSPESWDKERYLTEITKHTQ